MPLELSHHKLNNSRKYVHNLVILSLNLEGSKLITLSSLRSQCYISQECPVEAGRHRKLEFKRFLFHKFVIN
jgi:hypothetical protein